MQLNPVRFAPNLPNNHYAASGDMSAKALGGKGAGLIAMCKAGLPVPQGFIFGVKWCHEYQKNPEATMKQVKARLGGELSWLASEGGNQLPLMSVRSGAPISMPGMMDTILNVGLTPDTWNFWQARLGGRAVKDCYRRLITMMGTTAFDIKGENFEYDLKAAKEMAKVEHDKDLNELQIQGLIDRHLVIFKQITGKEFPDTVEDQLMISIETVFKSWNSERAKVYRKLNNIPDNLGTAVTVQRMVFGNLGPTSGTGVMFTRDPNTGEKKYLIEYLDNAQGEDVVAGIRTPYVPTDEKLLSELDKTAALLENHYHDMVDLEFTVEEGKLWLLQSRKGKRQAKAALKVAFDLIDEGMVTEDDLPKLITRKQIRELLKPTLDPSFVDPPVAKGIPASGGFAQGEVVFTAEAAINCKAQGKRCILVRLETSPDDIGGMAAAQGVLTAQGGSTCVSGKTRVVTDRGIFSAEELHYRVQQGGVYRAWSFDGYNPKWRPIINSLCKKGNPVSMSLGKRGRSTFDNLEITADHKLMTWEQGMIGKKEVGSRPPAAVCARLMPEINQPVDLSCEYFYLMGLLTADGYVGLSNRRGRVVFTQAVTEQKKELIDRVVELFEKFFGVEPRVQPKQKNEAFIGGRLIGSGDAVDVVCSRQDAAHRVMTFRKNAARILMRASKEQALWFLAGIADGDGASAKGRMQLYLNHQWSVDAALVAAARCDIRAVAYPNRTIKSVTLSEGSEEIAKRSFRHTGFVKGKTHKRLYRARDLEFPVSAEYDYRIRNRFTEAVKRDLMVDGDKIGVSNIPFEHQWMFVGDDLPEQDVYDFTVEADDEAGHSYVVLSSGGRAVWISNCHAAVVARGMDKPCVTGCQELQFNWEHQNDKGGVGLGGKPLYAGEKIAIDGDTGRIWRNVDLPVVDPDMEIMWKLGNKMNARITEFGFMVYDVPIIGALDDNALMKAQGPNDNWQIFDMSSPIDHYTTTDNEYADLCGTLDATLATHGAVGAQVLKVIKGSGQMTVQPIGMGIPSIINESKKVNVGSYLFGEHTSPVYLSTDSLQEIGGEGNLEQISKALGRKLPPLIKAVPLEYALFTVLQD